MTDACAVRQKGSHAPRQLMDHAVGFLQPAVEPLVQMPELQQLKVGKGDHVEHFAAVVVDDDRRSPVGNQKIPRRVAQMQPQRLFAAPRSSCKVRI